MAERIPEPEHREPMHPEVGRPMDWLRWGPVVGGMVATLATILVLNVLGLAIGRSSLAPGQDPTDLATGAGMWSAIAALIGFFVGGWVAGRSASGWVAGRPFPGLLNGAMVLAATLVLLLLVAVGAGGALSFFGASFDSITAAITTGTAITGAWGMFIALILTLAAAMLSGWLGYTRQAGRAVTS